MYDPLDFDLFDENFANETVVLISDPLVAYIEFEQISWLVLLLTAWILYSVVWYVVAFALGLILLVALIFIIYFVGLYIYLNWYIDTRNRCDFCDAEKGGKLMEIYPDSE